MIERADQAAIIGKVDQVSRSWSRYIRRRLVAWFVRWVFGFTILALVVHVKPNLAWLWWPVGAFAACSLAFILVIGRRVRRELSELDTLVKADGGARHH